MAGSMAVVATAGTAAERRRRQQHSGRTRFNSRPPSRSPHFTAYQGTTSGMAQSVWDLARRP